MTKAIDTTTPTSACHQTPASARPLPRAFTAVMLPELPSERTRLVAHARCGGVQVHLSSVAGSEGIHLTLDEADALAAFLQGTVAQGPTSARAPMPSRRRVLKAQRDAAVRQALTL